MEDMFVFRETEQAKNKTIARRRIYSCYPKDAQKAFLIEHGFSVGLPSQFGHEVQ
jgi:hypothetical protein